MASQQNPVLNQLFYGDNLAVLRDYIPDQSVDLIYLDPPFNSRQDYNVLFDRKISKSRNIDAGARSASQITAFKDTWEWNEESSLAYEKIIETQGINSRRGRWPRRRSNNTWVIPVSSWKRTPQRASS